MYEPLGLTLEAPGKTAEAIAEYRAALVEDPNYAYAHTNLALLLEGTGARDEAIAHLGTLDFVAARDNVVFLGPPGTGKTHCETGCGASGLFRYRDASVGSGDRD